MELNANGRFGRKHNPAYDGSTWVRFWPMCLPDGLLRRPVKGISPVVHFNFVVGVLTGDRLVTVRVAGDGPFVMPPALMLTAGQFWAWLDRISAAGGRGTIGLA